MKKEIDMKYIPAEKLKAEIERRKAPFKKDIDDGVYPTYLCALMDFEDLITSLQKEQPEVDLEKEIDRVFFQGDCGSQRLTHKEIAQIARHFYELGRLNARKED